MLKSDIATRMHARLGSGPVLACAIALATACGSAPAGVQQAGGDKAGGVGEPVVLRLADTANNLDYSPALAAFLHRVDEISRGQLRIDVTFGWGSHAPDTEQQVVRDVADGKADLTTVGSRAFDTMQVTAFRALQAPMLIDSYRVQDAVIKSDIPRQMLPSLEPLGVVGISVFAASMPKVIAVRGPILGPADWKGITFQAYRSDVQAAAIRALGATPTDTLSGLNAGLEDGTIQGYAKSLVAMEANVAEDLAPYVTANVNLWPQIDILIANPGRLAQLPAEQRGWLTQAAADARAEATSLVQGEDSVVSGVCQAGARLANASDAELVALRKALDPIYADLERDAEARGYITRIEALKRSTAAAPPLTIPTDCTGAAPIPALAVQNAAAATALNGVYRWTITKDDAIAHGTPQDRTAEGLAGYPLVATFTLKDGAWSMESDDPNGTTGTYTVNGDRIAFHWGRSILTFSFLRNDRGALAMTPVLPMDPGDQFIWSTEPWTKIN